jgi:hypothetical protein
MAGSYFILRDYSDFGTAGLLTIAGAIKAQAVAWTEWHARVGQDATLLGRDPLTSTAYSYRFDKGGAVVRVLWATVATDVLIAGAPVTLTAAPIYVDGDVMVTLAGGGELADFAADFHGVQGQPWEYGFYTSDGTWNLMTWDEAGTRWRGSGEYEWIRATQIHPQSTHQVTARVKLATAARVRIAGSFLRASSGGDSVDVRIRAGETVLAAGHLTEKVAGPFDLVADVPADTWLEFAVDALTSNSFDATNFAASITETTAEPSALPVVIGGGGGGAPGGSRVTLVFSDDGIVRWTATP